MAETEPFVWQLINVFTQKATNVYKPKLTVGRCKDVDIVSLSTAASRSHAEFILSEDGCLKVKDLNSLNGTYVNKRKIDAGIFHTLNVGDEVGIGVDLEAAHIVNNKCSIFKVQKINNLEIITLDDSDEEGITKEEQPIANENQLGSNRPEMENRHQIDAITPDAKDAPSNSRTDPGNDVHNQLLPSNSRIVHENEKNVKEHQLEKIETNKGTSSVLDGNPNLPTKVEPFDEELIVIDDDDDDLNVLSQVLEVKSLPTNNGSHITDDIFYNIKKEVEEMDKIEYQEWQYPLVIGSDNEDLSEIFAEELKEYNDMEKQFAVSDALPSAQEQPNDTVKELPSTSTNKNGISPEAFYKRCPPLIIEAQPLKTENNRKRKTDVKKTEKTAKKQKTTNSPGAQQESSMRRAKRTRKKESDKSISKEEKKKIAEDRKGKLKEIATKSTDNKSNESKSRINKPKVKVSGGRGNFLLNSIEAVPSTSKTKDPVLPNATSKGNAFKNTTAKQYAPVLQIESREKSINIDTSSEVEEVLSWNTNWLTKNEMLAYLNPVVRLKELKKLEIAFSSYSEYFEMNRSLLMVELWAHIQKEFELNRSNSVFPMFIEDCETADGKVLVINCLAYFTKNQAETLALVKESDLLVMDLRLQENGQVLLKPTFGYVHQATKCVLKNHHYINNNLAKKLGIAPHVKIWLKILTNKSPKELKIKSIVNFKVVTSLVSHLRLFKSLRSLEHSPLIKFVLKPNVKDFQIPKVPIDSLISKDLLNDLQLHTIMEAVYICSRSEPGLYMIQGPPGTGKTFVIKNIVLQLLFGKHRLKNTCLLLVAPSNAAIDQLVLKLVNETRPKLTEEQKKEMKLVRVGPASSIHPSVKPYCLEYLTKKNLKKELLRASAEAAERYKQLLDEIQTLEGQIQNLTVKNGHYFSLKERIDILRTRNDNFARELLKDRYNSIFSQHCDKMLCCANIICTTLSSCMGRKIEENVLSGRLKFACCIVDEATQSTEQETLIPIRLGIKRMVLVGDPQQLPATVMSLDAKLLGYGCSLFQRILKNFETSTVIPLRLLNKQYRMHPEICKFPNAQYYANKLESANFKYRKPLHKLSPFILFSLNASQLAQKSREVYRNCNEASFIKKLVEVLISVIPRTTDVSIGVVTPYQNQRSAIIDMLKSATCRKNITIDCNTVDSFQGQEMDIIILSCVREAANVFLSDAHRLNVALTRAKYALYVVGTKSLFTSCAALAKLRENAEERGLLKDGTHLHSDDLKAIVWDRKTD